MSQETTPRLFTLQTHEEYGFHTGVRADGTQVFAGGFHGHMVAYFFDAQGAIVFKNKGGDMGRYQAVDRNSVLDAAEMLVRTRGIAALTIDAVAKAAGISKGGVQSSFGTKDQLIAAMYERWGTEFDAEIARLAGEAPLPLARLRAHVEVTYRTDKAEGDRAAGLMASLLNAPEHLTLSQEWYASSLDGIDVSTPEGRRARLAFLANEGAFMLRCFGFMKMSEREWREIFADIRGLLDEANGGKP